MTDKLEDALKAAYYYINASDLELNAMGKKREDFLKEFHVLCPDLKALTAHEAAKAAAPDDVREAFEAAYRTGDPIIDGESLSRDFDGVYEAALARLCFKWFGLGHNAALRQPQGVPREVADDTKAAKELLENAFYNDGVFEGVVLKENEVRFLIKALALLNAQGV